MERGLTWWHTSVKFGRQAEEVHKFETCLIYLESLKTYKLRACLKNKTTKKVERKLKEKFNIQLLVVQTRSEAQD